MRLLQKSKYFYNKLQAFIDYAVFIWKEDIYREYDYWFIYKFLKFKLKRMISIWEQGLYVGSEKDLKNMQKLVAYIERYELLDNFGDLSCQTEEDYINLEFKMNNTWDEFHNLLRDNARRWWY